MLRLSLDAPISGLANIRYGEYGGANQEKIKQEAFCSQQTTMKSSFIIIQSLIMYITSNRLYNYNDPGCVECIFLSLFLIKQTWHLLLIFRVSVICRLAQGITRGIDSLL